MMGITTGVSWASASWNPWQGCDKVSDGCKFCYAEREFKRYGKVFNSHVVRSSPATFNNPLKWARNWEKGIRDPKKALAPGSRIFVCSWSDFFHKDADDWRAEAWEIIRQLPQYTFLIPTKRIERAVRFLPKDWGAGVGYSNVWLGISAENQKTFDERITALLDIPAAVHWVSVEPMLGPIDMDIMGRNYGIDYPEWSQRIDWVVFGGESGPGCRPCNPEWIRDGLRQCREAEIPAFVKQLGGWPDTRHELSDFPEDLRVREFPR